MSGAPNENAAEVPQKTTAFSSASSTIPSRSSNTSHYWQPTWKCFSVTNRFSSTRPYLYIDSQEYRSNRIFQSIRLSSLFGRIPNIFTGTPVRDTSINLHKVPKTFSYDHILLMQSKLTMVTISVKDPRWWVTRRYGVLESQGSNWGHLGDIIRRGG